MFLIFQFIHSLSERNLGFVGGRLYPILVLLNVWLRAKFVFYLLLFGGFKLTALYELAEDRLILDEFSEAP